MKLDIAYLHVRMYQEKPPYDGHRKTILSPQHTHVGVGLALEGLRLRLVELFVAKYVEVKPLTRAAKPGAQITFAAKKLKPEYLLNHVEVFYEPLPQPPELNWLREPRSYALPDDSRILRLKPPPQLVYLDSSKGVVDIRADGSFSAPVRLYRKEPGIYTIVAWIKRKMEDQPFPATEVCVRAE